MLPLPKHGFLSYFGRSQGSLLANVTPGKGLRGFLLPSTATRDQEPIPEDNEARGEDGGRGHVLDQLSALLHMNKSIFRSHAASIPGSLLLHANGFGLVGSISSRITSFLCGYRKLSTHSELGGMVLVRTAQEAGSKAIPPLTRSPVHCHCTAKHAKPSLPEAG